MTLVARTSRVSQLTLREETVRKGRVRGREKVTDIKPYDLFEAIVSWRRGCSYPCPIERRSTILADGAFFETKARKERSPERRVARRYEELALKFEK